MDRNDLNINSVFHDFPNICRLCLNKEEILRPIGQISAMDLFKNITNIEIESEDNLPKNICNRCVNQIEDIATFINLCKSNDAHLKKIVKEEKIIIYLEDACSESDAADNSIEQKDIELIEENVKSEEENYIAGLKYEIAEEVIATACTNTEDKKSPGHSTKRKFSNCEVCGEKFSTKGKLTEHQKKNVGCKIRRYKCTNCEKAFFTKFKLKVHMRSHTKETPYECKLCGKKFRFSPNLKRHEDIIHKGLKPFKCDICGKEFSRLERKIQHMNIHTGGCPYKCKYCSKSFKHRSTYGHHITGHKVKNGEIKDLSELECHICKKIFFSKQLLQSHIETHNGERNYLCSICGKIFLKKCYLVTHSRSHTEEKPFKCKECGKMFKFASGYKSHILSHTGERSFQCELCLKTFKQSGHLRSHVRTHTGEKPFKCSFCGKDFAYDFNLKAHTRIHTGETPYHCSVCDKGFYDSSSMKKHMKVH